MALRNIVQGGDPILKKVCREVTDFGDKTAMLLEDMKETLTEANGLGLAGPQVGIMRRLCIVLDLQMQENGEEIDTEKVEEAADYIELINPVITEESGSESFYEGCLSYPDMNGLIERPTTVTVKAFDRDGKEFTMTRKGIVARAICHECNHLDGITIEDLADEFLEDEDGEE